LLSTTIEQLASHTYSAALKNTNRNLVNSKNLHMKIVLYSLEIHPVRITLFIN